LASAGRDIAVTMLSRMLALASAASIVPGGMLYFRAVSRTNSARAIGNGWVFGTAAGAAVATPAWAWTPTISVTGFASHTRPARGRANTSIRNVPVRGFDMRVGSSARG
jgi:hypothetical protein